MLVKWKLSYAVINGIYWRIETWNILFTFCHFVDLGQHNSCQAFAFYRNRTSFSKWKLAKRFSLFILCNKKVSKFGMKLKKILYWTSINRIIHMQVHQLKLLRRKEHLVKAPLTKNALFQQWHSLKGLSQNYFRDISWCWTICLRQKNAPQLELLQTKQIPVKWVPGQLGPFPSKSLHPLKS